MEKLMRKWEGQCKDEGEKEELQEEDKESKE